MGFVARVSIVKVLPYLFIWLVYARACMRFAVVAELVVGVKKN